MSSYGTRANRAAADAAGVGLAAAEAGGVAEAALLPQQPQQVPFAGNGPYDLPPPFFIPNAGRGDGAAGGGVVRHR